MEQNTQSLTDFLKRLKDLPSALNGVERQTISKSHKQAVYDYAGTLDGNGGIHMPSQRIQIAKSYLSQQQQQIVEGVVLTKINKSIDNFLK